MKALNKIITVILSICIANIYANVEHKSPLEKSEIPNHIQSNFYADHSENLDVQWFPYPFQYKIAKAQNSRFFALSDVTHTTQYYEALFNENGKSTKKVFDLQGALQLEVSVRDAETMPQKLSNALISKGYENWAVKNYEIINRVNENKTQHKVILTSNAKTRALYFTPDFNLEKELKWEINRELYKGKTSIFYKSATHGDKQSKSLAELPSSVQSTITSSEYYSNNLKINEVSSVHIPEHKVIAEYYDLYFAPVYEYIYTDKHKAFKVTVDENGKELEKIEVISWDDLPKKVEYLTTLTKYTFWQFDSEVEKVELNDGTYCYRLHAKEFGIPQVLAINIK